MDVSVSSPELMDPKATMPITPRITMIVPCRSGASAECRARREGRAHVDVGVSDGGADEEAGEQEIEDEGGRAERCDVFCPVRELLR